MNTPLTHYFIHETWLHGLCFLALVSTSDEIRRKAQQSRNQKLVHVLTHFHIPTLECNELKFTLRQNHKSLQITGLWEQHGLRQCIKYYTQMSKVHLNLILDSLDIFPETPGNISSMSELIKKVNDELEHFFLM